MNDHRELHRRFHAHGIHVSLGNGGLARVQVQGDHPAELYLHGGHLTSWKPRGGRDVLWMSAASPFEDGKAIRGGIPVCLPWFGPHGLRGDAPAHGFARVRPWHLAEGERLEGGRVRLALELAGDEVTRGWWPHEFEARLDVMVGETLDLALTYTNTDAKAVTISEALHTYLAIGDVRAARVLGLDGCDYLDKVAGGAKAHEDRLAVSLAGETDRVYLTKRARAAVEDPEWGRRLLVTKAGSAATVVWNPWGERAATMKDMAPGGWTNMLCVEAANAPQTAIELRPGASHRLITTLATEPL